MGVAASAPLTFTFKLVLVWSVVFVQPLGERRIADRFLDGILDLVTERIDLLRPRRLAMRAGSATAQSL